MAGEANALLNIFKMVAMEAVKSGNPMNYVIGTVVSDEYKPLEIKVEAFSEVLEEKDLILTKAVQDHWLDIEVYWETVDDNDLSEFQESHNENIETYNDHEHEMCIGSSVSSSDEMEKDLKTSHLHNIVGRKKIRVYNGLHKDEVVLLLRCAGGQQYIVVDRLSPHIVGGEWRTHAGAGIDEQGTQPYEVTDSDVLSGWKENEEDESTWKRFNKPSKFTPGGSPPEQQGNEVQ